MGLESVGSKGNSLKGNWHREREVEEKKKESSVRVFCFPCLERGMTLRRTSGSPKEGLGE